MTALYGRDRRRRLSVEERQELYARARGLCQNCGRELPPDWQAAHLLSWAHGGATSLNQMEAWCLDCNLRLGARDVEDGGSIELRPWQAAALPEILRQLGQTGAATLHAAPGAGKTLFVGAVFKRLFNAGHVERMVAVVPNTHLRGQWKNELAKLGIHLDHEPRDQFQEHQDTVGAVVTYQSLEGAAASHRARLSLFPTLVVFDEVHHLAENASWGRAAREIVGDVVAGDVQAAAVLNTTGTLFRSSSRQRISTVRYQRIIKDDGEEGLEARADYSVATADLVGRELRPPDLYVYETGRAVVLDLREGEELSGGFADLSHEPRRAAVRGSFASKAWQRGFCEAALAQLKKQREHIPDEPLKLLYVAENQKAAKIAADMLNELTHDDFARLVISDEPAALKVLERAARERRPLAIVAVRMVTEGFDCPEISTIAYGTSVTADLFVAQTMARAMRITRTERTLGQMLPAMIVIPNDPELRAAFRRAIASARHMVRPEDRCARCGQIRADCACSPLFPPLYPPSSPREYRYQLIDLDAPTLEMADVLTQSEGEVSAKDLEEALKECERLHIPTVYGPEVVLFARQYRSKEIRIYATEATEQPRKATAAVANPRDVNLVLRARLRTASGWMQSHINYEYRWATIGEFQALANEAGGIPSGGRDQATDDQLAASLNWMMSRIREHMASHDEPVLSAPSWMRDS